MRALWHAHVEFALFTQLGLIAVTPHEIWFQHDLGTVHDRPSLNPYKNLSGIVIVPTVGIHVVTRMPGQIPRHV